MMEQFHQKIDGRDVSNWPSACFVSLQTANPNSKAHRELPVSQFSQGKPCFHYREPLFSLQDPCKALYFPVRDCSA